VPPSDQGLATVLGVTVNFSPNRKSIMRAFGLAAAFALYCVAQAQAQAQAELKTFCLESARHTCVDIAIETQPSPAGGTDVSIRIADVLGQSKEVGNRVPWYRLHRVDLIAADAAFQGGDILAGPEVTLVGAAEATGDVARSWPAVTLSEPNSYVGYSIATNHPNGGADIVGCILPPGQGHPYIQTCGVDGPAEIFFRFSTAGSWLAEQVTLVIAVHDQYAGDMSCIVGGTPGDKPDAHNCRTSMTLALASISRRRPR
jgi:hypothetical protein